MISNICEACDVSGRVVVIVGFLSLIESGLKQKCRLEFARATTTLILKVKFTNKLFNYINQKFAWFGGGLKSCFGDGINMIYAGTGVVAMPGYVEIRGGAVYPVWD